MPIDQPLYDVFTLGETMMRFAPPAPKRLGQSFTLDYTFGGAESNVAANLARLGRRTAWYSRLPANPLGWQLVETLNGYGVDTASVTWADGERIGTYYIEHGQPPRGIRVWYDRAYSAASRMQPDDLPLATLIQSRWVHLTGITAALSDTCLQTVHAAQAAAREHGIPTSFDVNYRALLWEPTRAASTLAPLCQQADVVFIARRDAQLLYGVDGEGQAVAQTLQARWGGTVIVSDGDRGAYACDTAQNEAAITPFPAVIVDRIGAGDAFASGIIDRLLHSAPLAEALAFGAALAALKLSIYGDIAYVRREEVLAVLNQQHDHLRR